MSKPLAIIAAFASLSLLVIVGTQAGLSPSVSLRGQLAPMELPATQEIEKDAFTEINNNEPPVTNDLQLPSAADAQAYIDGLNKCSTAFKEGMDGCDTANAADRQRCSTDYATCLSQCSWYHRNCEKNCYFSERGCNARILNIHAECSSSITKVYEECKKKLKDDADAVAPAAPSEMVQP